MAQFVEDKDTTTSCIQAFASQVDISRLIFPPLNSDIYTLLKDVSSSGLTPVSWDLLSKVIAAMIVKVVREFEEKYGFKGPITQTCESRLGDILHLLNGFDNAPFTIQRLVELLLEPSTQYTSTYKLMNGLERILSVTSTIDTYAEVHYQEQSNYVMGSYIMDVEYDFQN
mmetsp:Transcript_33380/g.34007  ORF Transcript_33380/g.34007 Transcript_33380/m.34007 type:complete len:170 (+) Transcript_33380:145-654(+)|eukprot:CAMPEP_0182430788 /NCGR_PEP_ID=MMETSP1167-20130531/43365_1 /TAXON_ID=2988 /ORGANISM="Mallomonas Sp, Strain CCMP3275" /LENGTH=169 /DNA_ID=CAMNT_0024616269 /DNA_START=49 /DNA_END=558 /DNA_ORIENTATION=-